MALFSAGGRKMHQAVKPGARERATKSAGAPCLRSNASRERDGERNTAIRPGNQD